MEAPDSNLYEYSVIRYVPRIDRGEFLNIGLLMMCKRRKWLKGLVIIDDDRIRAFHPKADLELIKNQSKIFERTDLPSSDLPVEEKYRWLTAVKSAILQTSPSHPGILIDKMMTKEDEKGVGKFEMEFERLFNQLVLV